MIIQVDTREQENTHVLREFEKQNIDYFDSVLDFGDYYCDETGVTVERKKDLTEFANNCGRGHQRFKRELERLDATGGKMYIVIERKMTYNQLCDWNNPRGQVTYRRLSNGLTKALKPMTGEQMKKICDEWLKKHNIEFVFVEKGESGRTIIKLLRGESV